MESKIETAKKVRAKFKVSRIERCMGTVPADDGTNNYKSGEFWTIHMSPVYHNNDSDHENSKFWQYTPSGSIQLGTVNKSAVEQFDLDREFYVDFTLAD